MLINCPKCKNSYNISDSLIPGEGALMNCSHCKSSFITFPEGLTVLSDHIGGDDIGLSQMPDDTTAEPVILKEDEILQDGRFEVKALLGRGGYGSVYRVFDKQMEMALALKVLVVPEQKGPNALRQLTHGFRLREKIKDRSHVLSGYLPLLDEYKGLSLILFPMELADGGSLRSWMAQNPDTENRRKQGLFFFSQTCLGVQAIHNVGLAHLDLKPENILIAKGEVKISDFDLSRDLANIRVMNPALIRDGVGTAHYMAPEQVLAARPKDVDRRADIYALGCILFELLDGDPPYIGTPRQILDKHNRGIKPKLSDVEEPLADIIWRSLETDPLERFSDVSELYSFFEDKDKKRETASSETDEKKRKLKQVFERFDMYLNASRPEERFFYKVQKWIQDALELLRWGADIGDREALYKLGVLYFYGDEIQEDKVEGFRLWKLSAEKEFGMAQYSLGLCYDNGEGAPKDKKKAVEWYFKAADRGITDAQKDLGNCYFYGEGIPEDKTNAVRWYRRAAENGSAAAQCNLGYCYYKGMGVPVEKSEAEKWLRKSAEQGYQDAARLLEKPE